MKKIKRLPIVIFIFVMLIMLLLLFSFGTGQRSYRSKLSNIELQIPMFSFFTKEYQDENTYTLQFKMLGSEKHSINEIKKAFDINADKKKYSDIYTMQEWAVNASESIFKTVILVYEMK